MRRSIVVSLALAAMVNAPAVAQTCQGLASFNAGQLQVAGSAQFAEFSKTWGANVTYGMPSGIYGGAALSTESFDNDGGSSLGIGAHAGYQMKLGQSGKLNLCPVASLALGMGPDDDEAELNSSSTDAHFGLALGTEMGSTRQLRILPTAGLGLQYRKVKQELGQGQGSEIEGSET